MRMLYGSASVEHAVVPLRIPMGLTNQGRGILVLESSPLRYVLSDS